jgi:hypothetical protein
MQVVGISLFMLILLTACDVRLSSLMPAQTSRRAVINLIRDQASIEGYIDFDLSNGPVNGTVEFKNLPYASGSLLKLKDGNSVEATISGTLSFTGTHYGGTLSQIEGNVSLNGTFNRKDDECTGRISGDGNWIGQTDALIGTLRIDAYSPQLNYNGCDAASPDTFWLTLPPLRYEPLLQLNPNPWWSLLSVAGIGATLIALLVLFYLRYSRKRGAVISSAWPIPIPVPIIQPPPTVKLESCDKCGGLLKPGKKFCTACGATRRPTSQGASATSIGTGSTGGKEVGPATVIRRCPNPQCRQPLSLGKQFCTRCGTRVI